MEPYKKIVKYVMEDKYCSSLIEKYIDPYDLPVHKQNIVVKYYNMMTDVYNYDIKKIDQKLMCLVIVLVDQGYTFDRLIQVCIDIKKNVSMSRSENLFLTYHSEIIDNLVWFNTLSFEFDKWYDTIKKYGEYKVNKKHIKDTIFSTMCDFLKKVIDNFGILPGVVDINTITDILVKHYANSYINKYGCPSCKNYNENTSINENDGLKIQDIKNRGDIYCGRYKCVRCDIKVSNSIEDLIQDAYSKLDNNNKLEQTQFGIYTEKKDDKLMFFICDMYNVMDKMEYLSDTNLLIDFKKCCESLGRKIGEVSIDKIDIESQIVFEYIKKCLNKKNIEYEEQSKINEKKSDNKSFLTLGFLKIRDCILAKESKNKLIKLSKMYYTKLKHLFEYSAKMKENFIDYKKYVNLNEKQHKLTSIKIIQMCKYHDECKTQNCSYFHDKDKEIQLIINEIKNIDNTIKMTRISKEKTSNSNNNSNDFKDKVVWNRRQNKK